MKINYQDFAGFEYVFLEDSFVLDLEIKPLTFTIDLELVLTTKHLLYEKPLKNEFHCYRKARIIFSNVESIIWTDKVKRPARDATGEIDFGNIDEFSLTDGIYKITGEIGNLEVISDAPKLKIF